MIRALWDALRHLFATPVTHAYPAKPIELPATYRGLIAYDVDSCTFCDQCEKACPPKAIVFFQHPDGLKEYAYNAHLCIYCGECVRACPKPDEALTQTAQKPPIATKIDAVNSTWKAYQSAARQSRDDFAAAKKAKKEAQKAQATPSNTPSL
ncbi:MAG: NADH-ubiquinone oxidoreductase subunit [Sulfurovum sp. PC08-66]|nr:MAG: NADH-ubiquinone oxidoreductase subunit [Sulfurovum sp. PC08-66]KIM12605.1 MAG: NADH-ubiquinone oxidoreductase subunit [Sulfuricurvum sp. PC08-66]